MIFSAAVGLSYQEKGPRMSSFDRMEIARHWQDCTRISRRELFGATAEKYTPMHLPDDAATMFAGYMGADYKPGSGIVLLGKNPGGGGDAYQARTREDQEFYPLLMEFKTAEPSDVPGAFEQINKSFTRIITSWRIWNILGPTLDAAGVTVQEIAYMNVIPYRTRGDKMPPVAAQETAWKRIVEPSLDLLAPKAIVALGKSGSGAVVDRCYAGGLRVFCVPRVIGDRYVSREQREYLELMRTYFNP